MKKLMMVSMIAMSVLSATAHADEPAPSAGVVKFHGAVVESPCFLSLESAEQTVELGDIAKSQLDQADGRSPAKPFQIKLEKCDVTDTPTFTISFNGAAGDKNELSVAESDRGVAVVINDKDGKNVSFDGTTSGDITMVADQNIIDFTAYVKKSSGGTVTAGDFTAETNFQIDYK
ncbi:fimbrial protein [Serratia marcescens]|uniref:fimbrial protein n=1 Tax=Serratia marcescens TaxID=615 RepID=UPI00148BFD7A|nr:fimbrial protein [Serratia marcescens]QJU42287.1 type 1 fimbrial protein [Serratia marcescens]